MESVESYMVHDAIIEKNTMQCNIYRDGARPWIINSFYELMYSTFQYIIGRS